MSISSVVDFGLGGYEQDWFIQNWTIPIDWLSSDPVFAIGLRASMSCSNDQIGMLETIVPIPGVLILGLTGFE